MNRLIITIILLIAFTGNTQGINHIAYKRDCDVAYKNAIDDKNYKESIEQLLAVKNKYQRLYCEEYMLMAFCYKKLHRTTKSAKTLKRAWSNYAFDLNCVMQVPEIQPSIIMEGYSKRHFKIVDKGFKNFEKLKTPITDSLLKVIQTLTESDQAPRLSNPLTKEDSIHFYHDIAASDSINLLSYKNIIYNIGFPGEWVLPGQSNSSFAILVHSSYDQEFYEEMKPILLKEVIIGHMPPSFYVLWLDRHNAAFDLPLQYGILDLPSQHKLSESEKELVKSNRLALVLIQNFPIPSTQLSFQ